MKVLTSVIFDILASEPPLRLVCFLALGTPPFISSFKFESGLELQWSGVMVVTGDPPVVTHGNPWVNVSTNMESLAKSILFQMNSLTFNL